MEKISFNDKDLNNMLSRMSEHEIDDLAFGAVQLNAEGKVLMYNAAEGEITGRSPDEVLGKNFFTEVAPCTNSTAFKGKFDEGVGAGNLNALFEYTFDYNMTPTRVQVHMKSSVVNDGTFWIFVKRL